VETHDGLDGPITEARPRVTLRRDGQPVGDDARLDLLTERFRAAAPVAPSPPRGLARAAVKAVLRRRLVEVLRIERGAPATGCSRVGGLPPVAADDWPRSSREPYAPPTHVLTVDLSVVELPPHEKVAVSVFADPTGNALRVRRGVAVRFTPAGELAREVAPGPHVVGAQGAFVRL
jgi:hypothetical protein